MNGEGGEKKELRRPMNAFFIFCKRHRSVVREKNPELDNRGVTRVLGDLWVNLGEEEKETYTILAKQNKDAFMKANPDYKWHNTDKANVVMPKVVAKPTNSSSKMMKHGAELVLEGGITPGKLADPDKMGGLNLLLMADKESTSKEFTKMASSSKSHTPHTNIVTDPVSKSAFLSDEGTSEMTNSALLQLAEMCASELHGPMDTTKSQYKTRPHPVVSSHSHTVTSPHDTFVSKRSPTQSALQPLPPPKKRARHWSNENEQSVMETTSDAKTLDLSRVPRGPQLGPDGFSHGRQQGPSSPLNLSMGKSSTTISAGSAGMFERYSASYNMTPSTCRSSSSATDSLPSPSPPYPNDSDSPVFYHQDGVNLSRIDEVDMQSKTAPSGTFTNHHVKHASTIQRNLLQPVIQLSGLPQLPLQDMSPRNHTAPQARHEKREMDICGAPHSSIQNISKWMGGRYESGENEPSLMTHDNKSEMAFPRHGNPLGLTFSKDHSFDSTRPEFRHWRQDSNQRILGAETIMKTREEHEKSLTEARFLVGGMSYDTGLKKEVQSHLSDTTIASILASPVNINNTVLKSTNILALAQNPDRVSGLGQGDLSNKPPHAIHANFHKGLKKNWVERMLLESKSEEEAKNAMTKSFDFPSHDNNVRRSDSGFEKSKLFGIDCSFRRESRDEHNLDIKTEQDLNMESLNLPSRKLFDGRKAGSELFTTVVPDSSKLCQIGPSHQYIKPEDKYTEMLNYNQRNMDSRQNPNSYSYKKTKLEVKQNSLDTGLQRLGSGDATSLQFVSEHNNNALEMGHRVANHPQGDNLIPIAACGKKTVDHIVERLFQTDFSGALIGAHKAAKDRTDGFEVKEQVPTQWNQYRDSKNDNWDTNIKKPRLPKMSASSLVEKVVKEACGPPIKQEGNYSYHGPDNSQAVNRNTGEMFQSRNYTKEDADRAVELPAYSLATHQRQTNLSQIKSEYQLLKGQTPYRLSSDMEAVHGVSDAQTKHVHAQFKQEFPVPADVKHSSSSESNEQENGDNRLIDDSEVDSGVQPVRKSRRANKGQKYQALINEGIIQPSKERLAARTAERHGRSFGTREEFEKCDQRRGLKRSASDKDLMSCVDESSSQHTLDEDRKTTNFDLEKEIKSLPVCSMEQLDHKHSRGGNKRASDKDSNLMSVSRHNRIGGNKTTTDKETERRQFLGGSFEVVTKILPQTEAAKVEEKSEVVTGSRKRKARKHCVTRITVLEDAKEGSAKPSCPESTSPALEKKELSDNSTDNSQLVIKSTQNSDNENLPALSHKDKDVKDNELHKISSGRALSDRGISETKEEAFITAVSDVTSSAVRDAPVRASKLTDAEKYWKSVETDLPYKLPFSNYSAPTSQPPASKFKSLVVSTLLQYGAVFSPKVAEAAVTEALSAEEADKGSSPCPSNLLVDATRAATSSVALNLKGASLVTNNEQKVPTTSSGKVSVLTSLLTSTSSYVPSSQTPAAFSQATAAPVKPQLFNRSAAFESRSLPTATGTAATVFPPAECQSGKLSASDLLSSSSTHQPQQAALQGTSMHSSASSMVTSSSVSTTGKYASDGKKQPSAVYMVSKNTSSIWSVLKGGSPANPKLSQGKNWSGSPATPKLSQGKNWSGSYGLAKTKIIKTDAGVRSKASNVTSCTVNKTGTDEVSTCDNVQPSSVNESNNLLSAGIHKISKSPSTKVSRNVSTGQTAGGGQIQTLSSNEALRFDTSHFVRQKCDNLSSDSNLDVRQKSGLSKCESEDHKESLYPETGSQVSTTLPNSAGNIRYKRVSTLNSNATLHLNELNSSSVYSTSCLPTPGKEDSGVSKSDDTPSSSTVCPKTETQNIQALLKPGKQLCDSSDANVGVLSEERKGVKERALLTLPVHSSANNIEQDKSSPPVPYTLVVTSCTISDSSVNTSLSSSLTSVSQSSLPNMTQTVTAKPVTPLPASVIQEATSASSSVNDVTFALIGSSSAEETGSPGMLGSPRLPESPTVGYVQS